ncbi:MAG: hypothetical protein GY941_23565 [Planctomycetes bacterium]|nr:hypothetical protein [Planctomycetota bacterium]
MNFKLTVFPALETGNQYTTFKFETKPELLAASHCSAMLLLFLQDNLKVMDDFSNAFICEELINGEWQELEEKQ